MAECGGVRLPHGCERIVMNCIRVSADQPMTTVCISVCLTTDRDFRPRFRLATVFTLRNTVILLIIRPRHQTTWSDVYNVIVTMTCHPIPLLR
jgi:hypothetical protein